MENTTTVNPNDIHVEDGPMMGGAAGGAMPGFLGVFDLLKNAATNITNLAPNVMGQTPTPSQVTLGLDKLNEVMQYGPATLNMETIINYILTQKHVLVQEYDGEPLPAKYLAFYYFPNITKPSWVLTNPKLTNDGIVFDCETELPAGYTLDVIASIIEDEEEQIAYGGSLIKLVLVKAIAPVEE